MDDNSNVITLLIRVSRWFRKNVESQEAKNYITKKNSILEIMCFSYLPVIFTSTLLAPMNRIKVIQQVGSFIPNDLLNGDKNNFNKKIGSMEIMKSK